MADAVSFLINVAELFRIVEANANRAAAAITAAKPALGEAVSEGTAAAQAAQSASSSLDVAAKSAGKLARGMQALSTISQNAAGAAAARGASAGAGSSSSSGAGTPSGGWSGIAGGSGASVTFGTAIEAAAAQDPGPAVTGPYIAHLRDLAAGLARFGGTEHDFGTLIEDRIQKYQTHQISFQAMVLDIQGRLAVYRSAFQAESVSTNNYALRAFDLAVISYIDSGNVGVFN